VNEREKLCQAIGYVAWGYVLMHVDFFLGTIDLLPEWAGYLLILRALPALGEERPSALLLRPLGLLLAAWAGVSWLGKIFALTLPATLYALEVIAAVVSLYFHFQLLTDLAAVARAHGAAEERRLLRLRTVKTLLTTVLTLTLPWRTGAGEVVAVVVMVAQLLTALGLCGALFSLRKALSA